jgi:hypothetical protein
MEGIQIVVQSKPRFRTVAEMREEALSRVTPNDIKNRIIKLKADVNVAMHKIDQALASRTIQHRAAPSNAAATNRQADQGRPRGISYHAEGRILSVR